MCRGAEGGGAGRVLQSSLAGACLKTRGRQGARDSCGPLVPPPAGRRLAQLQAAAMTAAVSIGVLLPRYNRLGRPEENYWQTMAGVTDQRWGSDYVTGAGVIKVGGAGSPRGGADPGLAAVRPADACQRSAGTRGASAPRPAPCDEACAPARRALPPWLHACAPAPGRPLPQYFWLANYLEDAAYHLVRAPGSREGGRGGGAWAGLNPQMHDCMASARGCHACSPAPARPPATRRLCRALPCPCPTPSGLPGRRGPAAAGQRHLPHRLPGPAPRQPQGLLLHGAAGCLSFLLSFHLSFHCVMGGPAAATRPAPCAWGPPASRSACTPARGRRAAAWPGLPCGTHRSAAALHPPTCMQVVLNLADITYPDPQDALAYNIG